MRLGYSPVWRPVGWVMVTVWGEESRIAVWERVIASNKCRHSTCIDILYNIYDKLSFETEGHLKPLIR